MDKKRSLLNVCVALGFKVILLVLSILAKRFLINYIGNDANGIFALYQSVIGVLAVADLGVGTAITFSMYSPIVNGEDDKVSALYGLFVKVYRVVGVIILAAGLCVMPALPYLANGYESDFSLYWTFLIMLASVVMNYMFSAKTSLVNAYKNDYVTTTILSLSLMAQYGAQILVTVLTHSFELYLCCNVGGMAIQWALIELYTHKKYPHILKNKQKVDAETKREVVKNTKAMFMHKIGAIFVNTSDSIIISAFMGPELLGLYSNYTTIVVSMSGILALCFTSLTSVIGHMSAGKDREEEKRGFNILYSFNFVLGIVFFLGYYAVIDDLVFLFFGEGLQLAKEIKVVITLNYFVQFMRQTVLVFRDATGTFYYDRFKPLAEGLLNIVLSVSFVLWFGITGVIAATILTNLLICHIVEPYVLYRHGFASSPKRYYVVNYACIAAFALVMFLTDLCMQQMGSEWLSFLVNGCIAVAIALVPVVFMIAFNRTFRGALVSVPKKLLRRLFPEKHAQEQADGEPKE